MDSPRKVILTGGAGFIGAHTAKHWIMSGSKVVVIDDLSRKGAKSNLEWLRTIGNFDFYKQDVTNPAGVRKIFHAHRDVDLVVHLAAQVAVTTSVTDPRHDFNVNVGGTFNVLEAIREEKIKPFMIYSSTNKVYGGLDIPLKTLATRYAYRNLPNGAGEDQQLDFHSPYGCSKGAADQYVRDYSRIYGIPTVVFRQSCIYGTRQFGVEDQGWIAHFIIATILKKPLTVYGDGKQVRDVLYIDDLVNLYATAYKKQTKIAGRVFNVGGGSEFTLSLLEFIKILEKVNGKKIRARKGPWRPGDQKVYVSDIRKAGELIGWKPRVTPEQGVIKLYDWVRSNQSLFRP